MRKFFLLLFAFGAGFLFTQNIFAAELVNINTADTVELDTLPGIGEAKAQSIVDYRDLNGLFSTTEDIMNVSGIGQATYDGMKDLITVGEVSEDEDVESSDETPTEVGEEEAEPDVSSLININTASLEELDTLPGIGVAKAQAIIDYKELNGEFTQKEDIKNVSGIGDATYEDIKDLITVGDVDIPEGENVGNYGGGGSNTQIIEEGDYLYGYEISSVVINEFLSDAYDGEAEFIELYNNSTYDIDLTDWWIEEGSGRKSVLAGTILANGFFVVVKPKGNLNNTGDIIKLFDPAGGLIDKVSYGAWDDGNTKNNAPKVDDPFTIARVYDGQDTDEDNKDFAITHEVTKGMPNIIFIEGEEITDTDKEENEKDPSTTSKDSEQAEAQDKVKEVESSDEIPTEVGKAETESSIIDSLLYIEISEILPNPVGSDSAEFIELFNPTDEAIDLFGAKLDDEDGGSRGYSIPDGTVIGAGEYMTFEKTETKIALNNTADSARLLFVDGTVIREIEYENVIEGASYSMDENDEWFWTGSITKNSKNIITVAQVKTASSRRIKPTVATSLELVRSYDVGDRVQVSGTVTVLPGIFGTQYFYIIDNNFGLQIYMHKKQFPILEVGDAISVIGEISQAYGETRVKVAEKEDIVKLGVKNELAPMLVEVGAIDNGFEGRLISVKGEVTELKGSYMYIDDGTDELKVYFKKGTEISKNMFELGDVVEVSGIMQNRSNGWQLLPRSVYDIVKTGENTLASTISENDTKGKENEVAEKYITATAGGLTSILIGLFVRARGFFVGRAFRKVASVAISFVKRG